MIRWLCFIFIVSTNANAGIKLDAEVFKVTDGDTIKVISDNELIKIRLAGIDCPEVKQPWGIEAKTALTDLLTNKSIQYIAQGKDRYGRVIGKIFSNEIDINRLLVRQGHCWVYTRYATDKLLFVLQKEAKLRKRGLWSLPEEDIVSPWVWRRRK